jgi:Cu(I)/Ag(I) efflux system protein CusF
VKYSAMAYNFFIAANLNSRSDILKNWILLMAALTITSPLYAEPVTPPVAGANVMTEGVVRKIDASNNKITLKHGPIVNLDMPGMTMVFRVKSADQLKNIKVGDAVKFHVERVNGAMTITAIEPTQ